MDTNTENSQYIAGYSYLRFGNNCVYLNCRIICGKSYNIDDVRNFAIDKLFYFIDQISRDEVAYFKLLEPWKPGNDLIIKFFGYGHDYLNDGILVKDLIELIKKVKWLESSYTGNLIKYFFEEEVAFG